MVALQANVFGGGVEELERDLVSLYLFIFILVGFGG